MTKFRYPSEGLYYPNRNYIDVAKSKITTAIDNSTFDIPDSFAYKTYLNSFKSLLTVKKEELDVIEKLFQKNDNEYKIMSDDIQNNATTMTPYEIKERDRLII